MLAGAREIDDVLGFVHDGHVKGDGVIGDGDAVGIFGRGDVEGFAFDIDIGIAVTVVDALERGEGEGCGRDLAFDHPGGAGEAVGDLFTDDFVGTAGSYHEECDKGEEEGF